MKNTRNMHFPRRLLALVLIFAIILGVPVPAMAAQPPVTAGQWNESTIWQQGAVDVDMDVTSDGKLYAAFTTESGGVKVCYYKDSDDGWVELGNINVTDAAGDVEIKVGEAESFMFFGVAYKTNSGAVKVLYNSYYKYSSNSPSWDWAVLGNAPASGSGHTLASSNVAFSIDINLQGFPCVAYAATDGHAYLTEYANGTGWTVTHVFSPTANITITRVSLDIVNGVTYMAYTNGNFSGVMKLTGGTWNAVGSVEQGGLLMDLKVVNNEVYLMRILPNDSTTLQIVKSGSSNWWETPISLNALAGISAASLYVAPDRTLYAAYCSGGSVTVKKYTGSSWESLGSTISQMRGQTSLSVVHGTAILTCINSTTSYPICQVYSLISAEANITSVIVPANAVYDNAGTYSATVDNSVTSQLINVTVSTGATWALYSDSACEQEIVNKTLNLNEGANTAYIKVTAENGTTQKYTLTITRDVAPPSSEKSVTGVTIPTGAVLDTTECTITATVANDVTSQQIDVTVSNNADWALYSDSACEQEIANKTMALNEGDNTAYIKVTAEDSTTQKYTVTITRAVASLAPIITTQPVNQTVVEGQTAAFTVAATGDAPLSYQWKKDGTEIAGATLSTLTINNANPLDAGSYCCYISNEAGNVTSNAATLTVNQPGSLVLTAAPGDQNITLTWNHIPEAYNYSVYKDNLLIETVSGSAISVSGGAISVTGLTNGVSYSFEVKALDSQLSVLASSGQITATPVTIPGIPTGITAIAGNSQATVSFTPPSDNGGSPITGYIVTSSPGNITAAGTGTTITVPGLSNGITYTFTVKAINAAGTGTASAVSNAVTPQSPSGSGSSGGSTTPVAQAPSGVTQIVVDVKQGNTDSTVSKITVERSTGSDGKKTDTVTYQEAKAEETVKKLKEENKDTARIVIPDEKDEVSQTKVNVPAKALEVLGKGGINLQIDTEEAKIDISKNTIAGISQGIEEDLYFWLVPIKDKTQRETVTNQALLKAAAVSGNTNSSISIVGNPVTIETNMSSSEADITLPLTGITLPSDSAEKAALLQQLAVYIEHSDGEKELIQGELVEFKEGVYGIRFHINKFSTFTVVKTDAFLKSSNANILKVIAPSASTIKGSVITASVANKTDSVTVKLKVNDKAVWKLYKDKNCTKAVAQNKLNLVTGTNISYVKVTADDGTFKVYKLTINREYSTAADILKVSTPAKARVKGKTVTAAVANETASVKINLRVSDKATWKLYSDKACTKEIANHKPDLKEGINTVYAKITAENGKTSKIYTLKITRKKAEYKEQIKLGLIGSKTYAEKVAKVFAEEYDCKNVVVKQEGKYYRITMNFPDKSAAIKACEDMIAREYIVHYYFMEQSK